MQKKEANAARDKEGQASTFAKILIPLPCLRDHEVPDRGVQTARCFKPIKKWAEVARDNEKDGPESTIAKKRAQLQSSLAKIEIKVYSLTQTQIEQNEREHRYARLREEAAKDLQVRTITAPADATSA